MRTLLPATMFFWATITFVVTFVVHALTYTDVIMSKWVGHGVLFASVLLPVPLVIIIRREEWPPLGEQAKPFPRWLHTLGGIVVLAGLILVPYLFVAFLLVAYNHPTKYMPSYAEVRLTSLFGLLVGYCVVLVSGHALAMLWWPGRWWKFGDADAGPKAAAEPGAAPDGAAHGGSGGP